MSRYYVRDWTCGVCDQEVVYDSHKHILSCGCKAVRGDPDPQTLKESFHVKEDS